MDTIISRDAVLSLIGEGGQIFLSWTYARKAEGELKLHVVERRVCPASMAVVQVRAQYGIGDLPIDELEALFSSEPELAAFCGKDHPEPWRQVIARHFGLPRQAPKPEKDKDTWLFDPKEGPRGFRRYATRYRFRLSQRDEFLLVVPEQSDSWEWTPHVLIDILCWAKTTKPQGIKGVKPKGYRGSTPDVKRLIVHKWSPP